MAASDWGLCKDCQWWQIDPEAKITNTTMGLCTEEALQPFRLRVSGNSGCTSLYAWQAGPCRRFECGPADRGAATLKRKKDVTSW